VNEFGAPTLAHQVSGEYSMIMAAAQNGWIDGDKAMDGEPHRFQARRRRRDADLLRATSSGEAEGAMRRRPSLIAAAGAAVIALSPGAFAQQTGGTADEAKAMLMKAIAAVRADEAKALDMFNKGEGGFRDRDLYVFCINASDGTLVAIGNPNLKQALGTDVRAAQNSTGDAFGAEVYAAIQKPEGQITEVSYMAPKPGANDMLAAKVSLVTRADSAIGCGVGYYK
jgi:hypothetical protein